jgi:hypothetical protein
VLQVDAGDIAPGGRLARQGNGFAGPPVEDIQAALLGGFDDHGL